jgi:hypothetical protein
MTLQFQSQICTPKELKTGNEAITWMRIFIANIHSGQKVGNNSRTHQQMNTVVYTGNHPVAAQGPATKQLGLQNMLSERSQVSPYCSIYMKYSEEVKL